MPGVDSRRIARGAILFSLTATGFFFVQSRFLAFFGSGDMNGLRRWVFHKKHSSAPRAMRIYNCFSQKWVRKNCKKSESGSKFLAGRNPKKTKPSEFNATLNGI
jgi:hypothetical protein